MKKWRNMGISTSKKKQQIFYIQKWFSKPVQVKVIAAYIINKEMEQKESI
jgi:hypothetical protein